MKRPFLETWSCSSSRWNKGVYDEDDLLALSGLQHIAYCERQWALIHIEGQWADSYDTVRGALIPRGTRLRGA